MDCSACLSCGTVVLLVMTGCRLFHILMVLGKNLSIKYRVVAILDLQMSCIKYTLENISLDIAALKKLVGCPKSRD